MAKLGRLILVQFYAVVEHPTRASGMGKSGRARSGAEGVLAQPGTAKSIMWERRNSYATLSVPLDERGLLICVRRQLRESY
jgi:hypothetical protein